MAREVDKPDAEWRRQLSDLQYRVTREKGTERAFTGECCRLPDSAQIWRH